MFPEMKELVNSWIKIEEKFTDYLSDSPSLGSFLESILPIPICLPTCPPCFLETRLVSAAPHDTSLPQLPSAHPTPVLVRARSGRPHPRPRAGVSSVQKSRIMATFSVMAAWMQIFRIINHHFFSLWNGALD
jgi:hypothetical protein